MGAASTHVMSAVVLVLLFAACGQESALERTVPTPVKTAPGTIAVVVSLSETALKLGGGRLALVLQGVTFRGQQHTGLRLFLNKPEADASTPISDQAYLGSVAPGHFDAHMTASADFLLNVSTMPAVAQANLMAGMKSGKLTVFCVPVLRRTKEPVSPSVSVARIELRRIPADP